MTHKEPAAEAVVAPDELPTTGIDADPLPDVPEVLDEPVGVDGTEAMMIGAVTAGVVGNATGEVTESTWPGVEPPPAAGPVIAGAAPVDFD